jgi:hypothetical protein
MASKERPVARDIAVSPKTEKRLPPPTISAIQDWKPEQPLARQTENRIASSSQQWKPVSAQIAANDAEASVPPLLPSSITIGSPPATVESSVAPANYQATPDGFSVPTLPYQGSVMPSMPPSTGSSAGSQPVLPGPSSSTVVPGPSANYAVPSPSSSFVPGAPIPLNPGTLPTYAPGSSTIINGEPFVTGPPCQFDAAFMLEPTMLMQNPGVMACPPTAASSYPGIPGNIVPPTVMPNQAPPGIYPASSAGHRPLIDLGQENHNVEVGRGIIGQPVAYVPGQKFRNFLRYIFP